MICRGINMVRYPIWDNRTLLGDAPNLKSAAGKIRSLINIPAGFYLHVWHRTEVIQEVCQLPAGIVYAVSNSPKN